MVEVLLEPPRRVGGIGPSRSGAVEGVLFTHVPNAIADVQDVMVARPEIKAVGIPLGASAVVGSENDKRVVDFIRLPEAAENAETGSGENDGGP